MIVTFQAPVEIPHVTQHVAPHVRRVLQVVTGEKSRAELMAALNIKDRVHFSDTYLRPALGGGVAEMPLPDKPRTVN